MLSGRQFEQIKLLENFNQHNIINPEYLNLVTYVTNKADFFYSLQLFNKAKELYIAGIGLITQIPKKQWSEQIFLKLTSAYVNLITIYKNNSKQNEFHQYSLEASKLVTKMHMYKVPSEVYRFVSICLINQVCQKFEDEKENEELIHLYEQAILVRLKIPKLERRVDDYYFLGDAYDTIRLLSLNLFNAKLKEIQNAKLAVTMQDIAISQFGCTANDYNRQLKFLFELASSYSRHNRIPEAIESCKRVQATFELIEKADRKNVNFSFILKAKRLLERNRSNINQTSSSSGFSNKYLETLFMTDEQIAIPSSFFYHQGQPSQICLPPIVNPCLQYS